MNKHIKELFSLEGKTAIVTGGGRGLGEAMAVDIAGAGASVVIADINIDNAILVSEKINKEGGKSVAVKVDVTDETQAEDMVSETMKHFGRVDILINSAGVMRTGKVPEELKPEDFRRVVDINLTGTFICCKAAGKKMIEQRDGRIINVASMSGIIYNKKRHVADYSSSKGGVIMLTKSLAAEWVDYNIRVNALAPGYMKTALTADQFGRKDLREDALGMTPMGRAGEPEELSGPVIFLASDASSFMTGHIMLVDGGYTIW